MLVKGKTRTNKETSQLIEQALTITAVYDALDAQGKLDQFHRLSKIDDATGLFTGALQYVNPEIQRQEFPNYFFATIGIPRDRLAAAGVEKITYQRSTYIGRMALSTSYGNTASGKVDANFIPVTYNNKRFQGYFDITNEELDKLETLQKLHNYLGQVSIIQEKRYAALQAWTQELNEAFNKGYPHLGIYGIHTHPDVPRIQLPVRLGINRTANENLQTLVLMEKSIVDRTKGVERPTTLILPTATFYDLNSSQFFDGVDSSVLKRFKDHSRIREIELVPELTTAGPNNEDIAVMYNRSDKKLCGVVPKDLTFLQTIPTLEGYRIAFAGEISGVHFKRPYSAVVLEYPAES